MNFQVCVGNKEQLIAICAFYQAQGYANTRVNDVGFTPWVVICDDRTLEFRYMKIEDVEVVSFIDAFKAETRIIRDIPTGAYFRFSTLLAVFMCVRFNKQTYGVSIHGSVNAMDDTDRIRPATYEEYIAGQF